MYIVFNLVICNFPFTSYLVFYALYVTAFFFRCSTFIKKYVGHLYRHSSGYSCFVLERAALQLSVI